MGKKNTILTTAMEVVLALAITKTAYHSVG